MHTAVRVAQLFSYGWPAWPEIISRSRVDTRDTCFRCRTLVLRLRFTPLGRGPWCLQWQYCRVFASTAALTILHGRDPISIVSSLWPKSVQRGTLRAEARRHPIAGFSLSRTGLLAEFCQSGPRIFVGYIGSFWTSGCDIVCSLPQCPILVWGEDPDGQSFALCKYSVQTGTDRPSH